MAESKSASVVFTNGSLLAKNAQAAAGSAKSTADNAYNLAYSAQKTADGKNSIYRGSDPNTVPTAGLKEGDIYFTDNTLWTWNGLTWEKTVSDTTGAEIHAKVEKAMAESKKEVADFKSSFEAKVKKLDDEIAQTEIKTGNALNFYKEQYYLSNSYTELTGGSWSDEVPPRKVEGKYVWSRYVTANVGDPTNQQYSDPVCISGLDGDTGPQGPAGADVYYSIYEMFPNQQTMYLSDLTPAVSATNLPKLGSHVIAPSGKIYEVTATYPNANPPQYGVGPQLTNIKGPKGDTGDQGIPGPKGADGQTTYVHLAYANSADGKTNFNVSYFSDALYVGTYTDYTQTDSNDYTKYTWSRLKGDTGNTGATGPKGDPGNTGFFIGTTPPPNPTKGTVWATNDSSGNMNSAKTWNGSSWVSTAFTQDLVAGNITATKIVGGELDVNKITVKNAQNIPVTSTVSLGDKLSDIEQDADELNFTVENGSQNLILNSGNPSTREHWGWTGDLRLQTHPFWKNSTENLFVLSNTSSTDEKVLSSDRFPIEPNQTYTLSYYAFNNWEIKDTDVWYLPRKTGSSNDFDTAIQLVDRVKYSGDHAQYMKITFNSGDYNEGYIRFDNNASTTEGTSAELWLTDIQLEKGSIATAWHPSPGDIAQLKITADSLNAYVKGSRGSDTLKAILSMDPNNSTIGQVVNGHLVAGINMSSDGNLKIEGSKLHITADTKIENATIKSAMIDSIEADKITTGTLNADKVNIINLTADKITSGTLNGMTITGSTFIALSNNSSILDKNWNTYKVTVENTGVEITGNYIVGDIQTDVTTSLTGGDLYIERFEHDPEDASPNEWTKSIDINTDGPAPYIKLVNNGPGAGKYKSTYISSDGITSSEGTLGNWYFTGYKARSDSSLYVSNSAGTNFDDNGSVGFQVWSGIGLGQNTIYTPSSDLYIQIGNVGPGLGQRYSDAGKVDVHCNRVISQRANSVSSRLSVKTDITPVTYERALAAVEGTEMYDYRYTTDDTGQHYVSGIIDDVNPDPQYHMDDMLINQERTARIDANLVGYHHVVLQELLKKIDKLEIKLKSLETILESKEN